MSYPKQIKSRKKIDALTGIKSSLDKIRSVIALVYLLYVANGRKASVRYSIPEGSKIKILPDLQKKIEEVLGRNNLEGIISGNPLITNQYEPLYVGVTLLMKLGYLKMEGKQNTAERTGGVRYPKQLYFANNTLVLDLILQGFPKNIREQSLYEWLQNSKASNNEFEERVCKFITTCTFLTQFKLRDNNNSELFFQTEGIYKALTEGNKDVLFSDSHEFVGPTRIYNNILKEDIEPWIGINKSILNLKGCLNPDAESINQMLSTTLTIFNVKDDSSISEEDSEDNKEEETLSKRNNDYPLQQIYYGAPGTGKSNTIKRIVDEQKKRSHRTTFHPDSDYSTFVGAYKPTMSNPNSTQRLNLSVEDLAQKLGIYYNDSKLGKIGGVQKFCLDYYPYIDGEYMSVNVSKLLELAGISDNYAVEINKYLKFCRLLPQQEDSKIVYNFTPQAFTNAYVDAWNTEEEVYLVIEEINRGNCAQIFGDLFQLLDRKNGVSEYPVEADADLQGYLNKALANTSRIDIPDDVKSGKKLMLPSNLYIWATMNTSDQSLFPIDSAFKRRWEWKYMKIKNEGKEWKIDTKIKDENGEEKLVDWWNFIRKVNEIIASMTSSADKQLGYFFCKADKKTPERASDPNGENDLISLDTFVSKVLFYLWNDVFKDYGFEDASLFQYIKTEDGKETKKDLNFPDFYKEDSNEVNSTMVSDFVQKVMNWKKKEEEKN